MDAALPLSGLATAQSLLGFPHLLTDAAFRVERKTQLLYFKESHHIKHMEFPVSLMLQCCMGLTCSNCRAARETERHLGHAVGDT